MIKCECDRSPIIRDRRLTPQDELRRLRGFSPLFGAVICNGWLSSLTWDLRGKGAVYLAVRAPSRWADSCCEEEEGICGPEYVLLATKSIWGSSLQNEEVEAAAHLLDVVEAELAGPGVYRGA